VTSAGLGSLLPLPVVLPIAGAVLSPLIGRFWRRGPLVVSVLALGGTIGVLALFCPDVYTGHLLTHFLGHISPSHGHELGIAFVAEPFGLTYALLAAAGGALLLIDTLSELGGLGHKELGGYAALFQLLLAALIGVALTADSVDTFVWFEVAALSSYGLTGFFLERPFAQEASFKIMVLTNMASFAVFIAAAMLYTADHALNFGQLHRALGNGVHGVEMVALGLFVVGFGTKAGLMPFHGWLADAHTAAPGPVSALFSGIMVNVGVLAIARLCLDVYSEQGRPVLGLLTVLGAVSAILGAVLALAQDDLKRLLAYDTVSQMGVLLVGVGTATDSGLAGTVYHMLAHGMFKALMFLAAGSIVHATGLTRISQMGGLARHRPVTTAAFAIGAASIMGLPGFSAYVSLGLIHDSLREHDPLAFAAMVVAQIVTVAALARATYLAFFRRRDDDYDRLEKSRPGMLIAFGGLAAGCLALSALPTLVLDHVVAPAVAILTDSHTYATAALVQGVHLHISTVPFDYADPIDLVIALGSFALGILLAWWYIRRETEPAPVRMLRRVHTGSVNDYTLYAGAGLAAVLGVLLIVQH
jgi:multicomponent Na+:H+ antiporter subunit D